MRSVLLCAVLSLVPACPPSPSPPPSAAPVVDAGAIDASPAPPAPDAAAPDAAPAPSSCAAACANLAALGCSEGSSATCVATLEHVIDAGLTRIDPACLARAKTKAAARACGSIRCP